MPSPYLFLPCIAPLLFAAPTPKAAGDGHVTIEIIETGPKATAKGKKQRTRFELPANGRIETWTDSGERSRFCTVESTLDHNHGERSVKLRCKDHPQSRIVDLEVSASPPVDLRGRMLLADIDRPDGRHIEVAITRS